MFCCVELCDFVFEHLTISRFRAGNFCSISLSNSGFLELFEENKQDSCSHEDNFANHRVTAL